jgi:predicted nucleotidyltransferase
VCIPIESLRDVIFQKLLDEDKIAIYSSEAGLYEDLETLQKLSFLIRDSKIIINREAFLDATEFVEKQEELLKNDRYAMAILKKLKQRAREIRLL